MSAHQDFLSAVCEQYSVSSRFINLEEHLSVFTLVMDVFPDWMFIDSPVVAGWLHSEKLLRTL